MLRIEKAVQAQFAEAASRPTPPNPQLLTRNATSSSSGSSQPATNTPFAKVNSVVAGSPAEDAGLRAHDLITRFESATWLNHDKLSKVAEVVRQNEGRQIPVSIKRGSETLELVLTPRHNWGGRGMLGCHLLPI